MMADAAAQWSSITILPAEAAAESPVIMAPDLSFHRVKRSLRVPVWMVHPAALKLQSKVLRLKIQSGRQDNVSVAPAIRDQLRLRPRGSGACRSLVTARRR